MNAKDEIAKVVNLLHRTLMTTTKGRVGGRVAGMPTLVLHTTGRKTGKPRTTMLTAPIVEDGSIVLVASYGGDDREPMWARNLRANGDVEVTMDGERTPMAARIATAAERAELWARVTATYKGYAGYQTKTEREIPLVILEPRT